MLDPAVRAPVHALPLAGHDHAGVGGEDAGDHRPADRRALHPRGALRHPGAAVRRAPSRADRAVLHRRSGRGRARPATGLQGRRRQQGHPPPRRRAVLRARPGPAGRARGLHPLADHAQRQAPAVAALPGRRRAAHHPHPGGAGHVRRDHHRRDGHQPPAPARAARAAAGGGAGRGGLHRGVPRVPRRRAVGRGELPQRGADLPRRRRARTGVLHQGRRLPGRPAAGDRVHQARTAREPRRHAAPAVLRAGGAGRPGGAVGLPRQRPGRARALRAALGALSGTGAGDAGVLHRGPGPAPGRVLDRFSEHEEEAMDEAPWAAPAPL